MYPVNAQCYSRSVRWRRGCHQRRSRRQFRVPIRTLPTERWLCFWAFSPPHQPPQLEKASRHITPQPRAPLLIVALGLSSPPYAADKNVPTSSTPMVMGGERPSLLLAGFLGL